MPGTWLKTVTFAGMALIVAHASGQAEEKIKPQAKPDKSYTIGVLEPNLAIPHFVAQAYGFTDEAQKMGMKVIMYDAGEHKNVAKQVSQMEDLIANKVDVIAFVPGTSVTAMAQVDQALAAGIPVVNVNIMSEHPKVLGRIRSDDYETGKMQGEFIVSALKGKGNVVMMSGVSGNSAFINRAKGFQDVVAKHPDIKILSEQWTPNATDRGLKLMEDWSQAFNKIDAVYYNDDTERFVREGWISATMAQSPVTMGRWGVRLALMALAKQPVPDEVFTPSISITKDNADTVDISAIRQPKGWKPPI